MRRCGHDFADDVYTLYITADHKGGGRDRELLHAMFKRLRRRGRNSGVIWVLATNPARFFYHAMAGVVVAERCGRDFGALLVKAAYGWADLNAVLVSHETVECPGAHRIA